VTKSANDDQLSKKSISREEKIKSLRGQQKKRQFRRVGKFQFRRHATSLKLKEKKNCCLLLTVFKSPVIQSTTVASYAEVLPSEASTA